MKFYNPFDIAFDSVSLFFCLVVLGVALLAAVFIIIINYFGMIAAALALIAGMSARVLYAVFKGK